MSIALVLTGALTLLAGLITWIVGRADARGAARGARDERAIWIATQRELDTIRARNTVSHQSETARQNAAGEALRSDPNRALADLRDRTGEPWPPEE